MASAAMNGDSQRAGRQQPQVETGNGGEKPQPEAVTTGARADNGAVSGAPCSAPDSAPVRSLQGALEMAAEEKGAMVSSLQQQEPTASQADGEATQLQVQERAVAALAASSVATTVPGSPSGAAHNLQAALDAAEEQRAKVSSSAGRRCSVTGRASARNGS